LIRALRLLKAACDNTYNLGINDPTLDKQQAALTDLYSFVSVNYNERDFTLNYLQPLAYPAKMFTVMFAIGSLPGWIAERNEQLNQSAGSLADLYGRNCLRGYKTIG